MPNMDIMNAVFEYHILNTIASSAKLLYKSIHHLYNAHEILIQFSNTNNTNNTSSNSTNGTYSNTPTYIYIYIHTLYT